MKQGLARSVRGISIAINRMAGMALAILLAVADPAAVLAAEPGGAASAGAKRIALLIGNGSYTDAVGPLKNPGNDVELLAAALKLVGFAGDDIRVVTDADRVTILDAVQTYADKLAAAGPDAIGFFYYSGHGAASRRDRRNYLIPVNVKALDRNAWHQAVALDDIIAQLANGAANAAHFVIFDACRNLLRTATKGTKGFVPVAAKRGMLIAFSTDPGETASDAGQDAGPYARALAQELTKTGQHHLDLFQNVKEQVFRTTGTQVPWERNGLLNRVYLNGAAPLLRPKPGSGVSEAATAWRAVEDTTERQLLEAFAARYPDSFFAVLAQRRLDRLKRRSARRADDFELATPQWQGVKGFRQLSQKEAIGRLAGYTVVYTDGVREFYGHDGTVRGRLGKDSSAGTWKVGLSGRLYVRYAPNNAMCSGKLSFNPADKAFRVRWREATCKGVYDHFVPGEHLTP